MSRSIALVVSDVCLPLCFCDARSCPRHAKQLTFRAGTGRGAADRLWRRAALDTNNVTVDLTEPEEIDARQFGAPSSSVRIVQTTKMIVMSTRRKPDRRGLYWTAVSSGK